MEAMEPMDMEASKDSVDTDIRDVCWRQNERGIENKKGIDEKKGSCSLFSIHSVCLPLRCIRMGSTFSSVQAFSLPPMEYHGCVVGARGDGNTKYKTPIAKPVDGDYRKGAYRSIYSMDKLWTCPIPDKPWVDTSLYFIPSLGEGVGKC